ncbi:MAG TPA: SpoIIE family protein phosphatase [Terracidiphilus sp.]|jgi:hypothetical protein
MPVKAFYYGLADTKELKSILGRMAALLPLRLACCWLALSCACAQAAFSEAPEQPSPAAAPANFQRSLKLDGPWKFQAGDDPKWADPAFDDSNWTTVVLSQPLTNQGIESYSGFGWYRLRLEPKDLQRFAEPTADAPLFLFVESDAAGQAAVYVNGVEAGWTTGMTDRLVEYQSPPIAIPLAHIKPDGPVVLAIRSWAGPTTTIEHGVVDAVELGSRDAITERLAMASARQWDERAIAPMVLAFLFLCVAGLGAALYLAQREHAEYLWLAILCAVAALARVERVAYGLAVMSLPVYWTLSEFTAYIFVAVTLEFVYRFTGSGLRRTVRAVQIAVLIAPFVHFTGIDLLEQVVSVSAEAAFCAVITVLLFKAWRRGRGDAGVMLVPFFLAATSDWINTVLGFAVSVHWLPQQFASDTFHLGPIAYSVGNVTDLIFLGSLIAVILYRFIRVSQDEQRANAEISAARSVQALLIPTQLPKNRNFVLESAYLPVNGVGGDFFQVLPLKDDSLLLVVGDVSGKGLQAAMNSSTLVGALRNEISHDPATVLEHLNRVLLGAVATPGAVPGLDSAPCFATCLCARIYPDATLTIANAGHLSPYREGRELPLPPGLPLGVIAESTYEQTTFQLDHRDRLVFVSDGVVEATNAEGELFGFERTQQVSHESAHYIAQTAKHFGQTDDITVVSLYIASKSARRSSEELARARD